MSVTVNMLAIILAIVAGIAMAVQGSMNSGLAKIIGLLESTLIVHGTATIVTLLLIFVLKLEKGDFSKVGQAPWYLYLGGLIGVLITYGVVASIPKLGVANATTLIIAGQVSAAFLIDYLGLFGLERIGFTWYKLLGLGLLAVGTRVLLH
jgi:transporter family-2 protein